MGKRQNSSPQTDERRTERLIVRMTPIEMAKIRSQAEEVGWSVGKFVRHRVCNEKSNPMPINDCATRELAEQIRGMRADLGRIGNNVNQLAHVANATGRLSEETGWETVRKLIDEVREKVEALHGRF